MARQDKLPVWVRENVPNDAVWGETYVVARKEETRNGNRVYIKRFLKDPVDASITGREIKDSLEFSASPAFGIALIVIGAIAAVLTFILKKPEESPNYLILVCAVAALIGGVYLTVKSAKAALEIASIASFEALEPYIKKALNEKVFDAEIAARKAELGETGAGYAGYFCVPARLAAQGDLSSARQNFEPGDELRSRLIALAATVPEQSRRLVRKG